MKVGPTSGDNGFPVWYKDENGVRLQLNLNPNDPLSGLAPEEIPNPTQPVSFPNNFPSEAFYQAAEAEMTTGTGERARLVLALEAAFVNEIPTDGEQMVFGRVRVRVSGLVPNAEYTIRHPYGTDTFIAEPDPGEPGFGEINFTEDIGSCSGGDFHLALNSRIHPFLRWDPTILPLAPEGYIGNPNELHPIIGSVIMDPNGQPQNYFRIEGPGIGIGSPDRSTTPGINPDNCIETRNFILFGTIATNSGVDVTRVTYSKSIDGSRYVDVFAISDDTPQDIEVTGPSLLPTRMEGSNGTYFTRVSYIGDVVPNEVTVTNISDNPDSSKKGIPVDFIGATAEYNTDTKTLTIIAQSSNEIDDVVLTVSDFGMGPITIPTDGILTIDTMNFSPANVTIISTAGGEITIPVHIIGSSDSPIPVNASAGEDQIVLIGTQVTLDGSNSTGPIDSFFWEQVSGTPVTLENANTPTPTFIAPNTATILEFLLTVTGQGGPSTSTVSIQVVESAPTPIANAGSDQTVLQGTVVSLDGSASSNVVNYLWEQISGITVLLSNANTANPSFTFPKQIEPMTFRLTVSGPGGSSTDTVQISTIPNSLTVTQTEFRTRDAEWRIEGTSNIVGPGVTITIFIGNNSNGPILANVEVDTLGQWRYRISGSVTLPDASRVITIQSTSGGILEAVPINIRR